MKPYSTYALPTRTLNGYILTLTALMTLAACLIIAVPARATALKDFNLIALGNVTGGSDVEGRVVVFGDVNANGSSIDFSTKNESISDPVGTRGLDQNDSLIVGGQLNGSPTHVGYGNARIKGSDTGAILNMNEKGSKATYNDNTVQKILKTVRVEINDTVTMLNGLTTNAYADTSDMNYTAFNLPPGDDSIAVFDLSSSFFNRGSRMGIEGALSDTDLIVIRVSGKSVNASSGLNPKNHEFGLDEYQEKIIWYFPEATALSFVNGLGGSIIAPKATLTFGNPIEGTVVANNIILGSEIHLPSLDSPVLDTPAVNPVPEPATVLLLGLGILGILAAGRRQSLSLQMKKVHRAVFRSTVSRCPAPGQTAG